MAITVDVGADAPQYDEEETTVSFGDGRDIRFYPTKTSRVLMALMKMRDTNTEAESTSAYLEYVSAQLAWLEAGMNKEDWRYLQDRLEDTGDPLEVKHLQAAYDQ